MAASAVKLKIIAGGALDPGLDFVAAAFQKQTGHSFSIEYNLGARGLERIDKGAGVDLVVATSVAVEGIFRAAGKLEDGGINVGRVGIGMMVRSGVPLPDISSAVTLKRAVLDAESILHTEEASGLYVEQMLRKLGIYARTQPQTLRTRNGPELIDQMLSSSCRVIGFLPLTAIRTYKDRGIVLVGPLPEEVQCNLEFIAVPTISSSHKEIAWDFARYCGGPGRPLLVANGVQ